MGSSPDPNSTGGTASRNRPHIMESSRRDAAVVVCVFVEILVAADVDSIHPDHLHRSETPPLLLHLPPTTPTTTTMEMGIPIVDLDRISELPRHHRRPHRRLPYGEHHRRRRRRRRRRMPSSRSSSSFPLQRGYYHRRSEGV